MTSLSEFAVTETLRNGVSVTFRALRPDDRERMAKAARQLDRESVYMRLFSYRKELTEAGLDRIMAYDPAREAALVVITSIGGEDVIAGSGRYVAADAKESGRTAEVAFVVDEKFRGLGIAGRLLEHLVAFARGQGIAVLEADVLAVNKAMLGVFARSGLSMRTRAEGSTVHVTLSLHEDQA